MRNVRTLKQRLSAISRLWAKEDFDAAIGEVDRLLKDWPGNGHLHVLWACLVQLQDNPTHSLDQAKQALQQAVELEKSSPAGAIELGHFLDNVEDDPQAASRVFSDGAAVARQLLIEGLIGQAKALHQLDKREDAVRCLLEALNVMHFQSASKRGKSEKNVPDVVFGTSTGGVVSVQLKGRVADQFEELLTEVVTSRSA
jgi:tetratricopeptide (TPR) repeat protein